MPRRRLSTGNPDADAKDDFDLARQREVLSRLGRWVRRQPDDVNTILPFDEVVVALGRQSYACLAEGVEAWGFRASQALGQTLDRTEVAQAWFRDEYEPAVALLRDAGLIHSDESDTEAYGRLAEARYLLLRSHAWDDEVIAHLRGRT